MRQGGKLSSWAPQAAFLLGPFSLAHPLMFIISLQELVPEFYSNDPSFLVGAFNGSCMGPLGQCGAPQSRCHAGPAELAFPAHPHSVPCF